jgi:hypothetical protein
MLSFTINISDEEEKALLAVMRDIEEWTNNAIHNRARQAMILVINEYTDKQAGKLSQEQRIDIIKSLSIETAKEREDRLLAEMGE